MGANVEVQTYISQLQQGQLSYCDYKDTYSTSVLICSVFIYVFFNSQGTSKW